MNFKIKSDFLPSGDQPEAIQQLCEGLKQNKSDQVLLGVTGSGKTFTMANVIKNLQRPALIFAPNKTLAAQLYSEMKSFFPENCVEYFVSYYDYYTPEAYVARTDTYIEKESSINEQIDRMRHSATRALLERRDTIIVASVSCIYGIGSVQAYQSMTLKVSKNQELDRDLFKKKLVELQFKRNEQNFLRGTFRNKGDILEIFPSHLEDRSWRISFFGDIVEEITEFDPLTGKIFKNLENITIYANSHYVTPKPSLEKAIARIKEELKNRVEYFQNNNKLLEAQRIEQRTKFDLEMIAATGSCSGIENYSRHLTGRMEGEPPPTLFEYLPDDTIIFIDESHVTIPQIGGMYKGDRSRKENLSEHGFRLPSCKDNRPLMFEEWTKFKGQTIYVSATPGSWELEKTSGIFIEQIVRPTGLTEPNCLIHNAKNQVEDLIEQSKECVKKKLRVLVTTLTKKMAEDLTDYLNESNIKTKYLHSDIDAIERIELIKSLRLGEFDVLVGINLLREGLDIPECGLVAILDADKEGFLRSKVSLIQTIGRAARNINGKVILYADNKTKSIYEAIEETDRRRKKQVEYNKVNNIKPRSTTRKIIDIIEINQEKNSKKTLKETRLVGNNLSAHIKELKSLMIENAENLNFEKAAEIRDEIKKLEKDEIGVK
tara:strand:- start:231 stop:2207 length:1977 start_codon:yes stop_codon:yes gene_type:complete